MTVTVTDPATTHALFVTAAYSIAILVIGGYAWSILARRQATERQIGAWSASAEEQSDLGGDDGH